MVIYRRQYYSDIECVKCGKEGASFMPAIMRILCKNCRKKLGMKTISYKKWIKNENSGN